MIRFYMTTVVVIMAVAVAFGVQAQVDKGPDRMELFGGSRGPVPFTHGDHQDRLQDCLVCHGVFPQEQGSIESLKSKGELKKKQVMNKLCIKCHRAERSAGNASGPLTCGQCHVREQ